MKKLLFSLIFIFSSISLFSAEDMRVYAIDSDLELPLEGVRLHFVDSDATYFTDVDGYSTIDIPETRGQLVIIAESIGYESRKILIKDYNSLLTIEMIMEGVLEGQELVVEVEAIGKNDEEIGVSTVIEKEMIQSAAKIGVIEDVMSAIKILPGVIYSEGFGSGFSVRGGTVDGLTTVLDGFVVKYPYHWGGAFSIFNPNIIESVKFSPGIFSSKYGQANSALMEVNTVKPNDGFKMEAIVSTSTLELFTQIPIGDENKFGIFGGFRLTNYDLILGGMKLLAQATDAQVLLDTISPITRSPYIYDFYVKAFYRPTEIFEWSLNGFWGNDGIGINVETPQKADSIVSSLNMDYFNSDFFVSTNLKLLATDNLLINFLGGYEYWNQEAKGAIKESGTKDYSADFIATFGALYTPETGNPVMPADFTIETATLFTNKIINSGIQGRLDFDWSINDYIIFQSGLGTTLDITSLENYGGLWSVEMVGPTPTYTKKDFNLDVNETKILNSFAYINFDVDIVPQILEMDLGLRVDHSYFMGENNFTLNTYPIPGPRLNLTYSFLKNGKIFKNNRLSLGVGLFSKAPFDSIVINKDYGIKDFELASPKTLMSVLGWNTELPGGFHFKIESYYKYVFDRYYQNYKLVSGLMTPVLHTDGIGHVGGGDLLIENKASRYLDFMLTYSFVYARYFNRALQSGEMVMPGDTEPRGLWYYPSFHRFHSLNLLLDLKPTQWFNITTKLTFATGTPKKVWDGDKVMYYAIIEDESGDKEMAEMYNRGSQYSDTLRMNWILDLDLKFSFHSYAQNSKVEWELYLAVENLLSPLLLVILPNDSVDLDKWNGGEKATPAMGLNFPIPSLGFQMSY